MFCINCFHKNTKITNSRQNKKSARVWRRRLCSNCKSTFTTYERPSLVDSKSLENANDSHFNLGRLTISIFKSFTHNPSDGQKNALWLAQTVEDALLIDTSPLTIASITKTTYKTLKRYDELAALQYAAQHQLISSLRRRGRPSLHVHEQPSDA
jgi:transcriptional regulator NrdR family protein